MHKFLLLLIFLCTVYSLPASSDSHFQFHKVYAGLTNNLATVRREAKKNARNGLTVPNLTVIECKRGVLFGVAVLIAPRNLNYVSVMRTWYHPHLRKVRGRDYHMRSIILRKNPRAGFGLRDVSWRLEGDDLIDGDITLALHRDNDIFLRHVFRIRGCEPVTADEVPPDEHVASVAPPEIVRRLQSWIDEGLPVERPSDALVERPSNVIVTSLAPPEILRRLQSWIDEELLVERPYISGYVLLSVDNQPILDSLDTITIRVDPSTTYEVSKTRSQPSPLGGILWSGKIGGQRYKSVSIHVSENGETVFRIRTDTERGLIMIRPTPMLPYHIAYWRAME